MSRVTDKRHKLVIVTVTLTALLAALLLSAPAVATSTRAYTERATQCPEGTKECAGIAYAPGKGALYVVGKVEVTALGRDKQQWDKNQKCEDLHLVNGKDLAVGQYGLFIVPAPCSYRLTIHIAAGSTTNKHVFVAPACEIVLVSTGTTYSGNDPKVETVKWVKGPNLGRHAVSDKTWHENLNETKEHYCNKDADADKNFN